MRAGKLKPLAITSAQRHALLPSVPTFQEQGVKDFIAYQWYGMLAPAGTPREILTRLQAEVAKAYSKPELLAKFAERGVELVASTSPEAFAQTVKTEVDRLRKVAREANIKAE